MIVLELKKFKMSKKLKFKLYKKGLTDNVTFKLNAMNDQWLVIKTLKDDDTHKFPMCSLEITELKQFLNENYPEL
tara:strand:- start:1415 stop:1639 length:225 start_codon:yes stop_codon:yes gene_type:complete